MRAVLVIAFAALVGGSVVRLAVDEMADDLGLETEEEGPVLTPGKAMRRSMLKTILGKILCKGPDCSSNVCKTTKSNATSLARYEHKKAKLRKLAEFLAKKKCTYRFVGGMREFRNQWLPRTCAAHWVEFDHRMAAFDSCNEVPRNDMTSLSQAVWGLGEATFTAMHASLDSFLRDILNLVNIAYNGNDDIRHMLELGDCELNLNLVVDELLAVHKRAEEGVDTEASLNILDRIIFGQHCDFEKAKMPWLYLRMRLLKTLRALVHGLAKNLLTDGNPSVMDPKTVEEVVTALDLADDPHEDDNEIMSAGAKADGSLIQLEASHEPVTVTAVTLSTGVIIAAVVGGIVALGIAGVIIKLLMPKRRVKISGATGGN